MSKKQPKEIHVDKLIIHAKEVIVKEEGRRHFDPWLAKPVRKLEEEVDVVENENDDEDEDHKRRSFSWV